MSPPAGHAFGPLDWFVLAAYTATLLGIGLHFARRQRTAEQYFVGGRQTGSFLAGLSLLSAFLSVITYVSSVGEYVQYGPVMAVGVAVVAIPFLQLAVGRILIPVIMRLPITSAYELLEGRLGLGVRQMGSVMFILTRLVWMALILYIGTTLLVNAAGCDPRRTTTVMIVTGLVTTVYTLSGGIRTVMITEVVQFFVLLFGALLTLVSISIRLGGVAAWWPTHWEGHWETQPLFSLNPHVRVSIVLAFLGQLIVTFCAAGSDQASVQRFLTTRDAAAARRAYLFKNVALALICLVLALVGAALLAFYRLHPEARPPGATFAHQGDAFFPHYISHYLPSGVAGLALAGIMAAAMSGLSSGMNAVTTVVGRDFLDVWSPVRSDRAKLRTARALTLAVGGLVIGGGLWMGGVRGDILEVTGKTVNLLVCPLFSLFFLALFVRFSTPFGAIFGALYGTTAAVEVAYWDRLTGLERLSFLWMGPVSLAVSLAAGTLFSLLPTRGRSRAKLAGWSAMAGALLVGLAGLSLRLFR